MRNFGIILGVVGIIVMIAVACGDMSLWNRSGKKESLKKQGNDNNRGGYRFPEV